MKRDSNITFNQLALNLKWIRIVWNGRLIYDDDYAELYPNAPKKDLSQKTGLSGINYANEHYGNRYVYSMHIIMREWHHCELIVEGEDTEVERVLVFQEYSDKDYYVGHLVDKKYLDKYWVSMDEIIDDTLINDIKQAYIEFTNTRNNLENSKIYEMHVKSDFDAGWYHKGNPIYYIKL